MTERTTTVRVAPPAPLGPDLRAHWMLDPSITYLNHGCFGARLREVFAAQDAWRRRFEGTPVKVLERERNARIDVAKRAIGSFLGMAPGDFGLTTNATDSVNAVLRSLRFRSGDQIATTTHVYNAVRQTMQHLASRCRASCVEIDVPFPVRNGGAVVDAIAAGLTERTRLLIVDHVTSPTAVRLPIERILALCADRGIDVLVDGAHAPGMIDLDVQALGAAYYAGNLHKWIGAPPGAGFLWVRPDRQEGIHPTVISHFRGEGLAAEFAWQGTRDISPWVGAADAIARMDRLAGANSWPRIMAHNHEMAVWAQSMLADAWEVEPGTPVDGSMLGSMASLAVPAAVRSRFEAPEALHDVLYDAHGIEVPIIPWGNRWLVRPCCQVYNVREEYERLARAVLDAGR